MTTPVKTGPVWVHKLYLGVDPTVDIESVIQDTIDLTYKAAIFDFNMTRTQGSWYGQKEEILILEIITGNRHDLERAIVSFVHAFKTKFNQTTVYLMHHTVDSEVL